MADRDEAERTAMAAMDDATRMARWVLAECDRSGCSVLPQTEHLCAACRDAKAVLDRYSTAVTGPIEEAGRG